MVKVDFFPCRNVVVLFFESEREAQSFANHLRSEMQMQDLLKRIGVKRLPALKQPRPVG